MEHRPLLRQVLAGRQPGGVVARLPHLLLGLAPEHVPTLDLVNVTALQAWIRPRSYVGVTGPDAASYLQRMVSNDVEALGPGEACEALLLTAKARLIAPLTVLRRSADDFLLLTEPSLGEAVAKELTRFRFAAKCTIEPEEHTSTIVLGGTHHRTGRSRRSTTASRRTSSSTPPSPTPLPAAAEELERLRILARTPAWGRELDDRVLPAEAGLEERAISFTKGCYPGQEPIARLHYRGHPNRGLRVLALEGDELPAYDAELQPRRQGRRPDHERRPGGRRRPRARLRAARGSGRRDPLPRLPQRDTATLTLPAPVAQGIERCPAEAEVARSNRAGRTAGIRKCRIRDEGGAAPSAAPSAAIRRLRTHVRIVPGGMTWAAPFLLRSCGGARGSASAAAPVPLERLGAALEAAGMDERERGVGAASGGESRQALERRADSRSRPCSARTTTSRRRAPRAPRGTDRTRGTRERRTARPSSGATAD